MGIFRTYLVISLGMFIFLLVGMGFGIIESLSVVGLFVMSFLWPLTLFYGLAIGLVLGIGMLGALAELL